MPGGHTTCKALRSWLHGTWFCVRSLAVHLEGQVWDQTRHKNHLVRLRTVVKDDTWKLCLLVAGASHVAEKGCQNVQKHDPILGYIFWPLFWALFHKLVGGGSPGTKSVPKTGVVFRTRFFGFGNHFLHRLATQCAPQHAPWPPGIISNFERWVQPPAMEISSRRVHTKAEEGRAQRSSGSARPPIHE